MDIDDGISEAQSGYFFDTDANVFREHQRIETPFDLNGIGTSLTSLSVPIHLSLRGLDLCFPLPLSRPLPLTPNPTPTLILILILFLVQDWDKASPLIDRAFTRLGIDSDLIDRPLLFSEPTTNSKDDRYASRLFSSLSFSFNSHIGSV